MFSTRTAVFPSLPGEADFAGIAGIAGFAEFTGFADFAAGAGALVAACGFSTGDDTTGDDTAAPFDAGDFSLEDFPGAASVLVAQECEASSVDIAQQTANNGRAAC